MSAQHLRSLLLPLHRKPPQQMVQMQPRRLPSTYDRLDDIRGQESQTQDAAHIGLVDFLGAQ